MAVRTLCVRILLVFSVSRWTWIRECLPQADMGYSAHKLKDSLVDSTHKAHPGYYTMNGKKNRCTVKPIYRKNDLYANDKKKNIFSTAPNPYII